MTDEFAIKILEQYREKPTLINEIEIVEEAVWLDEALTMGIKALKHEPSWIPVSERLPKANEFKDEVRKYYLVQNEYDDMLVACYDGRYWSQIYTHSYIKDRIVAWMPLPEPYEPQESEEV